MNSNAEVIYNKPKFDVSSIEFDDEMISILVHTSELVGYSRSLSRIDEPLEDKHM